MKANIITWSIAVVMSFIFIWLALAGKPSWSAPLWPLMWAYTLHEKRSRHNGNREP